MLEPFNWSNQNKGILKHCKMIIRRRRRLNKFKKFPSYQKGHRLIHLAKTYVVSITLLHFKLLFCLGNLRKNPVVYFYRFYNIVLCNGIFQLEIYDFITITLSLDRYLYWIINHRGYHPRNSQCFATDSLSLSLFIYLFELLVSIMISLIEDCCKQGSYWTKCS